MTPPLSPEQGAELYRCMLLDTISRARALAVDTFIFYHGEKQYFQDVTPDIPLFPQDKSCLGCRMAAAFTELGSMGYRARVVIGTDAPDLPLSFIEEAFVSLETGSDAVFGPAEDGGYYLVGLRGPHGGIFKGIKWSRADVLEKSLERSNEAGFQVSLLPTWYDVDSFEDLCRPGLSDPNNSAPLTRDFIASLDLGSRRVAL